MIWSLYHKLLCGNLFLFPIVFFSFLSQKEHTLSIQEFLTFFLQSSQSHDTADNELILTLGKTDFSNYSLRKHPFLLALRRWGRFAKRPQR